MNSPSNSKGNQVGSDGNETNQKKQSHSSRRRKAKSVQENKVDAKIREIANLLSKSLTVNEPETSDQSINSPTAIEKNHERFDVSSLAQFSCKVRTNNLEEDDDIPSTSSKHLEQLFQNLQVHNPQTPIEMYKHSQLLNTGKINESGLQVYKLEEIEEIQRSRQKESSQKMVNKGNAINASENHCNVDLIKNSADKHAVSKSKQGSVHLVNKLHKKYQFSVDGQENSSSDECESENSRVEQSKVDGKCSSNSVKPKPNQFRNDSKNDRRKGEKTCKASTHSKKSKKNSTGEPEPDVDTEEFDGKQKVFFNSSLNYTSKGNSGSSPGSPSTSGKASKFNKRSNWPMKDRKYPKFFTEEEMGRIAELGLLLSGTIRINQKNINEAYISAPDKGKDILIRGLLDRNRALEGDEVYYVIKSEKNGQFDTDNQNNANNKEVQRKAVVVAIKRRNHNKCAIGTVKTTDNGTCAIVSPRDNRIPKIRVGKKYWPPGIAERPEAYANQLVFAKINFWDDINFAEGEIKKIIGKVGDIDSETAGIMLGLELDDKPYPESLSPYLPTLPFTIPEDEISQRLDLRKECIFTVDPATAKDLDDALSFKKLENGNYQVGVHISDVTYFLHDDTPLDYAVRDRATSVYLVQKVYHMLPPVLCQLCSLIPDEDKLTFSVIWEFTPEFDIVDCYFTRSVINSCGQFSYEQVQDILDGSEDLKLPEIYGGHTKSEIVDALTHLHQIALHLRRKRFDNGALRIDQTKIIFSLGENGLPIDYFVFINKESHRLIEELMLLANMAVADRISSCFPKIAFLRSHASPSYYMLNKIKENLEKYGITLDISSSKSLNSSLLKYSGTDPESVSRMTALNMLLAKAMARATYFCSSTCPNERGRKHYALNVSLYTHFTSPIRRYADVMVHRLLAASLKYRDPPSWTPTTVQNVAVNCNNKKYAAKLAGEKSTEMYLVKYIMQRAPFVCKAIICEIKDHHFDFILLDNGFHHRYYYKNFKGKFSVKVEDGIPKLTLRWPKKQDEEPKIQVIGVFSIIDVELLNPEGMELSVKLLETN